MKIETKKSLVHGGFLTSLDHNANGTALIYQDKKITYKELDQITNRLANFLADHNVKRNQLVGVMLDKSELQPISLLGILKSGGAYVPLDPSLPEDRLKSIINKAKISIILTETKVKDKYFPSVMDNKYVKETVWIDSLDDFNLNMNGTIDYTFKDIINCSEDRLPIVNEPLDLACVLFTSGTTGDPKGVMLHHQGLANCLNQMIDDFNINKNDRFINVSPYGFDMSLFEIFAPLLSGASLYLLSSSDVLDPWKIFQALVDYQITIWNSVPTTWSMWLDLINQEKATELPNLRLAFLGGEKLDIKHVRNSMDKIPDLSVVNVYGPTETSIWMSYHKIESMPDIHSERLHVGKPIRNVEVYILDENMDRCKPGEIGEIYIAGHCVSKGYLDDINRTSMTFIDNPFTNVFEKMYKTGDLGKWLPNGNIDIIGRNDHQVKIRGFRVELGDIESIAIQYAGVQQAVVVLNESRHSHKELHCFIKKDVPELSESEIRAFLNEKLPSYMIPHYFHFVDKIPVRNNGKINRTELLDSIKNGVLDDIQKETSQLEPINLTEIKKIVTGIWSDILGHKNFKEDDIFFNVGGDSLQIAKMKLALDNFFPDILEVADLYTNYTVQSISEFIYNTKKKETAETDDISLNMVNMKEFKMEQTQATYDTSASSNDIAIIGMACRFPEGANLSEFWDTLESGKDAVGAMHHQRLNLTLESQHDEMSWSAPHGGYLKNIEQFDASFFNISSKEASQMDPQHRIMLEVVQETIENAGYAGKKLWNSDTGVFLSASMNDYMMTMQQNTKKQDPYSLLGNQQNMLPNRISFHYNWNGPSVFTDTACSSSLVAVHQACQSIRNGECTTAVAGGVALHISPERFSVIDNLTIASRTGRCRAFDEKADGTISGEGAGAVLLKPLKQAIEDKDVIHAVIKGSAVNHGGRSSIITAPNPLAQEKVIRKTYEQFNIPMESISYVETHGTGTPLGDPIEIQAMSRAFGELKNIEHRIPIGSVKSSIGHLAEAAGIASIIKTVLALKMKKIPKSLHYQKANPKLNIEKTPFYVNDKLTNWDSKKYNRRASINSFGLGGTNAHLVVEEAPHIAVTNNDIERKSNVLTLSAKNTEALSRKVDEYYQYLKVNESIDLGNLCFTSNTGREHFPYRYAVTASTSQELMLKLAAYNPGDVFEGEQRETIFFIDDEQLDLQNLGSELYKNQPLFKEYLKEILNLPASSDVLIYLQSRRLSVSARFAILYAIAKLWKTWLPATTFLGVGIGKYVAKCLNEGIYPQEVLLSFWDEESGISESNNELSIDDVKNMASMEKGIIVCLGQPTKITGIDEKWIQISGKHSDEVNEEYLYSLLKTAYLYGNDVDWFAFEQGYSRSRVELPSYPFQRKSYWFKEVKEDYLPVIQEETLQDEEMEISKRDSLNSESITNEELEEILLNAIRSLVPEDIDIESESNFFEFDVDSLVIIELVSIINETLDLQLKPEALFNYSSVQELAAYIQNQLTKEVGKDNVKHEV